MWVEGTSFGGMGIRALFLLRSSVFGGVRRGIVVVRASENRGIVVIDWTSPWCVVYVHTGLVGHM